MTPGTSHYFAYGSNMNPNRVRERGIQFTRALSAALAGFELRFDKVAAAVPGGAHANIGYAPRKTVQGVLYELAHGMEITKMDRFEMAPVNYSRELVCVDTADGPCWAWTYFANRGVLGAGLLPPRAYLDHLLAGADYLPDRYLEWLASIECVETNDLDM